MRADVQHYGWSSLHGGHDVWERATLLPIKVHNEVLFSSSSNQHETMLLSRWYWKYGRTCSFQWRIVKYAYFAHPFVQQWHRLGGNLGLGGVDWRRIIRLEGDLLCFYSRTAVVLMIPVAVRLCISRSFGMESFTYFLSKRRPANVNSFKLFFLLHLLDTLNWSNSSSTWDLCGVLIEVTASALGCIMCSVTLLWCTFFK